MSTENEVKVEAGVDWMTVTAKSCAGRSRLYDWFTGVCDIGQQAGEFPRDWSALGYAGKRCGGVRFGTRHTDDIAIVSGIDALIWWPTLARFAEHCSRIDLAVTVFPPHAEENQARTCFTWLRANRTQGQHCPRCFTYYEDKFGGQTVYLGSRSSAQCGRLYDKGIQAGWTKAKGLAWRYEVEYKKPMSGQVLDKLTALGDDPCFPAVIRDTVYTWFIARDVPPLFPRRGDITCETHSEARVTDDDMSLAWLTKQIKPTVRRLLDHNRQFELYASLGLPITDRPPLE